MKSTHTFKKLVQPQTVFGVFLGVLVAIGLTSMAEDSELDTGPRAIPYNGILEYNGEALNGQADLHFTLTDVPGGEGASCLFEEEHDNVTAYTGRFSVNIGSVTGDLPDCVFDSEAMYIEVGVRDATANEDEDATNDDYVALNGSQRIHPVPFSYWAAEGSDFKVDGDLRVSGSISNDDGAVTINDGLEVTSNLDVQGVIGNSSGSITINDELSLTGFAAFGSGLRVSSNLNVQGVATNSTGNFTVSDNLDVTNDVDIAGGLTTAGNTILQGNVYNNEGSLSLTDDVNIGGDTTIGSSSSTRELTVNGATTINDTTTINGAANINGRLYSNTELFSVSTVENVESSGSGVTADLGMNRAEGFCFLTQVNLGIGNSGDGECKVYLDGSDWLLFSYNNDGDNTLCGVTCIKWSQ